MRGKVIVRVIGVGFGGITPAYAGKSSYCKLWAFFNVGSPPPMRGKEFESFIHLCEVRDHPRLCGEKPKYLQCPHSDTGSPPPMRGKARFPHISCSVPGITPAYAGKSCRSGGEKPSCQDHPRLCGEKKLREFLFFRFIGSPPPMRGKGFSAFEFYVDFGITPAYAGKSYNPRQVLSALRDHPRLCGEKFHCRFLRIPLRGSPPPMRGKDAETFPIADLLGITPAYAGKRNELSQMRKR